MTPRLSEAFKRAKHGWAFLNASRLANRIARCIPLVQTDGDREVLEQMKSALRKMRSES